MQYQDMTKKEMQREYHRLCQRYQEYEQQGLQLDLSRGKPAPEQLALSQRMLGELNSRSVLDSEDGTDCRNYGGLDGIPEAKALLAGMIGVRPEQVMVGGNSSLTMMFDILSHAMLDGLLGAEPWVQVKDRKFLCPVPGYDRHFTICESFGIEMINVPMTAEGPDMDMVEELIKDKDVKGMWCVPKYSNPEGIIYSEATIRRIAAMKPAASDFVLMWDNAYCVHEFDGEYVPFPNILEYCREAGNPDMVFEFASTSKITFPGAGVACFATSRDNMAYMKKLLNAQVISFDKMNQLRHVLFLKDKAGVLAHMKKHAAIMKPKFDAVIAALDTLAPYGIASYNRPKGGYFVSLNVMNGCAKRVHQLMKEAGVVMTGPGATFPYGKDPDDKNLRIAPSLPPVEDVKQAMEVLCACIKLAAAEKMAK